MNLRHLICSIGGALVAGLVAAPHAARADDAAWTHDIAYTADVTGGLSGAPHAGRALDNLDVIIEGDLDKAVGWRGGKLHLYLLNNSGGQPNDQVGTLQGVDNIEVSRPRGRLYELWIEQALGDKASVLAGLYDLNSEFYSTEASDLLIAPPFGIGSELASTGPNGPSIFPSTALAVRVRTGGEKGVYLQAAALNAHAGTIGDPDGPKLKFDNGALLIAEGGWRGPGRVGLGAWAYSKRQDDIRDLDPSGAPAKSQAYGVYALAEWPLSDAQLRAAHGFMRIGASDAATTPFKAGWQVGVKVEHVLAARPDSAFSVGLQQGFLSGRFRRNGHDAGQDLVNAESGVEVTYSDALGRVSIQPDLQLIRHPGGERARDFAVVGAIRLTINLN